MVGWDKGGGRAGMRTQCSRFEMMRDPDWRRKRRNNNDKELRASISQGRAWVVVHDHTGVNLCRLVNESVTFCTFTGLLCSR
jgi:hypothetical protein